MSQSVALRAVSLGNQSAMELAAAPNVNCSRQYALSAAKRLKSHLSLAAAGRYIVAIATAKSNWVDNSAWSNT